MQKSLISLIFVPILISCVGQTTINFEPGFTESKETTHKISDGQEYTFGYLEVLENRSISSGKTIELPVYIFKSRSPYPQKDPIIYTVGGPGSTTMPSAQYMNYYEYLDDRDLILVEQRGNYYAKPHLDCPEWSKAIYMSNLPDFETSNYDSLLAEAAKLCREKLVEGGADLNSYNTNEIAADINDLVNVLGVEEYNLLTLSYSTKIAQVLLRDFPQRIRSVVMDSPLPLEVNYDEESIINLLSAVDKLLSDCETQPDCNQAFPDLKSRFHQYLRDITETPMEVIIENPSNGNPETFRLRGKDLITVFTGASTGDISRVPFEINKLLSGDVSSLKKQLSNLFQEPSEGAGIGMRLSVWCSEEYPFSDPEIIERETFIHPELRGLSPAVFDSAICTIWGVSGSLQRENEPVKSNIPVLLISGEYDNETPPKWVESMKQNLTNSYHLMFKGWKHGPTTNWSNQCAMNAANDFFNDPHQTPSPECLDKIDRPVFEVE